LSFWYRRFLGSGLIDFYFVRSFFFVVDELLQKLETFCDRFGPSLWLFDFCHDLPEITWISSARLADCLQKIGRSDASPAGAQLGQKLFGAFEAKSPGEVDLLAAFETSHGAPRSGEYLHLVERRPRSFELE
jgi:hypothetical protein